MKHLNCLILCLPLLLSTNGSASDWTRFRGNDGQGISESTAPVNWSQSEGVAWKLKLPGAGSSSPIVVGNRVFVTCYRGVSGADAERTLICVDAPSGKTLWQKSVGAPDREDAYSGYLKEHGYASGTPVSDGKNVYAFFGKAGVVAYSMDGEQLWKTDVGQMSANRRWGSGGSPVLAGNVLIVNASEEARAIIGLDKATGKELWKAEYDGLELCYATPVVVEAEDNVIEAVISMPGEVWGLNTENGKLRWFCEIGTGGNVSPSVVVGKDSFFTFGGYPQQQTNSIKRNGRKNVTSTHHQWEIRNSSYVATPLLFDDHLYWVTDKGQAMVVDSKTSDTVVQTRLSGLASGGRPVYASPVKAGNLIYVVSRRSGTYVFEANPGMKQVATNPALDDSDFNGTPAVVDGAIYLRSNEALYCIK